MTPQISIAVLLALGVVGLACLLGPLIVQFVWARHRPWLWASFAYGALTFAVSQLLTRIPLITNVLPVLPEWQAILANAVLSAVILGFSAGLFEETGRLIVMGTFFRKRRTHADGVSFGLGHGGLEAGALVGLGMLSLAVLGLVVRSGGWANLAAGMPPRRRQVWRASSGDSPSVGRSWVVSNAWPPWSCTWLSACWSCWGSRVVAASWPGCSPSSSTAPSTPPPCWH